MKGRSMPLAIQGSGVMKEQREKKRSFRKGKKARGLCLGEEGLQPERPPEE